MTKPLRDRIDCCTPDCPDRCADPNCHGYCKRYKEQKDELEAANKERARARNLERSITGTLVQGVERVKKKTRKAKRSDPQ